MFKKASKPKLVALMAPISLAVGLSLGTVNANAGQYLTTSDGKVVVNSYDECWRTIGGAEMNRPECGDPEPDADGDGVPDSKDQCPGTPAGMRVDASGCPLDSDGDGVPNSRDRCPNTPAGAKVNMNGCDMVASVTITTNADHFAFDSDMLKPAMESELDDIAAKLNASGAQESVNIIGHTDSTGPADYNQALSERRAQAVANYLSNKGVGNLSVSGMGEASPIASNATREGRAMNRRVEIKTQ